MAAYHGRNQRTRKSARIETGFCETKAPWMFASGATPQPTHHTHALNNCHQKRHPNVWLRHTATLGPGNDASSNLRKQKPPTQNHVLPAPQMFNVASQGLLSLGRIYAAWQVLEGCFNGNFESRGRGGGGFCFCRTRYHLCAVWDLPMVPLRGWDGGATSHFLR